MLAGATQRSDSDPYDATSPTSQRKPCSRSFRRPKQSLLFRTACRAWKRETTSRRKPSTIGLVFAVRCDLVYVSLIPCRRRSLVPPCSCVPRLPTHFWKRHSFRPTDEWSNVAVAVVGYELPQLRQDLSCDLGRMRVPACNEFDPVVEIGVQIGRPGVVIMTTCCLLGIVWG